MSSHDDSVMRSVWVLALALLGAALAFRLVAMPILELLRESH